MKWPPIKEAFGVVFIGVMMAILFVIAFIKDRGREPENLSMELVD